MRAIVLVVIAVRVAAAEPVRETIAYVGDDRELRVALDDALASAGIRIVAVGDVPAPALGELAAGARAVAERANATATVWLIAVPQGAMLVAYDRAADRVLVRELPRELPLSAAHAAEAARMARTMLRALRVTPDSDLPPPHAPATVAVTVVTPQPPLEAAPSVAATVGVAVRMGAPAAVAAPALALAAAWRPEALGAALAFAIAPSGDVAAVQFSGAVRDTSIALVARLPFRPRARATIAAEAGVALHVVTLYGTLAGGTQVDTTSVDVALRAGATALYRVHRGLGAGVAVYADTLLDRQRYDVGGAQILVVPRVQATAALVVALDLL